MSSGLHPHHRDFGGSGPHRVVLLKFREKISEFYCLLFVVHYSLFYFIFLGLVLSITYRSVIPLYLNNVRSRVI